MIYGIDFGTSNSLLGAFDNGSFHKPIDLDAQARDASILRSVMFFPDRGKPYFGSEAIAEYVRHGQDEKAGRLIRSVKKFLPQPSFSGTLIGGKTITIEEMIATFLSEMRTRANSHFKKDVTRVVLGRPARFSERDEDDRLAQDRLEKAAKMAGFTEIHFCPEPIAAAHEFRSTLTEEKTVLVTDFGGGTSDFTVIKLRPVKGTSNALKSEDVLSIGGISIAGDALDGTIMRNAVAPFFGSTVQYKVPFGSNVLTMPTGLMEKICSPADISILRERDTIEFFKNVQSWSLNEGDRNTIENLFTLIHDQIGFSVFEEIERTKKALGQTPVETLDFNYADIHIKTPVSKTEFEQYAAERIERILKTLDDTVARAGLKHSDIDLICSTGGTAKVPAIRDGLQTRFKNAQVSEHNHFHSIVQGLTHFAADL